MLKLYFHLLFVIKEDYNIQLFECCIFVIIVEMIYLNCLVLYHINRKQEHGRSKTAKHIYFNT